MTIATLPPARDNPGVKRIALAIARPAAPAQRDTSGATAPRTHVFDDAFSPVWDEAILQQAASRGRAPAWWKMAHEVLRRGAEYDAVVTWGEKLTLAMLLQQRFSRRTKPHVALMYQFEKPNIRIPLELLKRNLHAVVTWSSVQRRALIERLHYPRERIFLVRHYVDQLFYSPRPGANDMICAVGAEMRDYTTLVEAARGTGLRCHIATDHVRVPGNLRTLSDRRIPIEDIVAQDSAGITAGRKPLGELRDLYARSRFVVIPLLPSDTDNGVTCILQAMAMGKPVICSATRGQVDVIEDGVTGLYVPVGDAAALRAAILSLWNDPQLCSRMGLQARAFVERHHTLERFTSTVLSAAEASLDGRPAPDTWWQ